MSECQKCGGCSCNDVISVSRFSHPDWDMKLIMDEASGGRAAALDFLAEESDPSLLVEETIQMTVKEFENLTEWSG